MYTSAVLSTSVSGARGLGYGEEHFEEEVIDVASIHG